MPTALGGWVTMTGAVPPAGKGAPGVLGDVRQLAGSLPYAAGLMRVMDPPNPSLRPVGHGAVFSYFTRSTRIYGTKPAEGVPGGSGRSGRSNSTLSWVLSNLPLQGPKIGVPGATPLLARKVSRTGPLVGLKLTIKANPFAGMTTLVGKLKSTASRKRQELRGFRGS